MKKILTITLGILVVLGAGAYLLATKANAATPIDPLFKLDLLFEDIQRFTTLNEVAKTELEQKILEERQEELENVLGLDDISQEDIEECLKAMNQQREKVSSKLGEVKQKQEEKGNTQAIESLEKVQNQYQENLQKQYETVTKAQEQYGVGESAKQNIDNALKNQGVDIQNQQENRETEGTTQQNNTGRGNN